MTLTIDVMGQQHDASAQRSICIMADPVMSPIGPWPNPLGTAG
jgi:hypothetical protein